MLTEEIEKAQRQVRTDAYQMSIGEVVAMYVQGELIIDPEFQRLFRWSIGQKSKLIESILLGIPIPSIFIFEKENGEWELVDGLQRVSTILEFIGILRNPDGGIDEPLVLESTKYLPSLHNSVWETSEKITDLPEDQQRPISKALQLAIRRSRFGVEILKRPSDEKTKYDLFQRLNAGGTQANPQELRNCIVLMVNKEYFKAIKLAANNPDFLALIPVSEEQMIKQKHVEWAMRFLVHVSVPYDGKLDVEEFIDEGIVNLATVGDAAGASDLISRTFKLLNLVAGNNALRRPENGGRLGQIVLAGLEGIAVGVAKNLLEIEALGDLPAQDFVRQKIKTFWDQPQIPAFSSLGLRGTVRIQRSVPFGEEWFRP